MDEDIFDEMVETFLQPAVQDAAIQTSTRWDLVEPLRSALKGRRIADGTDHSKLLDPDDFFQKYRQRNSQGFSSVPTADAPFQPNPIYLITVKPTLCMRKKCQG
jgi:hypothetical protein